MKLTQKSAPVLTRFLLLGTIAGTLLWFTIATILDRAASLDAYLMWEPVGIQLAIIELSIRLNPGSLLGLVVGALLFKKI